MFLAWSIPEDIMEIGISWMFYGDKWCNIRSKTIWSCLNKKAENPPNFVVYHHFPMTLAIFSIWYTMIYIYIYKWYIYVMYIYICNVYIYMYMYIICPIFRQPHLGLRICEHLRNNWRTAEWTSPAGASTCTTGGIKNQQRSDFESPITLRLCQNSYWKLPFIVELHIKHGDFPQPCWFTRGYSQFLNVVS